MQFDTSAVLHQPCPMYLRDWFAAAALAGILANAEANHAEAVEASYQFADAMLKERERQP